MEATRQLVVKKVEQMFHPNNIDEVKNILDLYSGPESERVHLALLKLSDGRLDKLRLDLRAAQTDYRDVVAPAEYPKELQQYGKISNMTPQKAQSIRDEDKRQYLEWLNSSEGGRF